MAKPTLEQIKAYYRQYPRVDFSRADAEDPSIIEYKLFTRKNPDDFVKLNEENVTEQNLEEKDKTVLLIHGWNSSDRSHWISPLKNAYLEANDYNVICVNWSMFNRESYRTSSANARRVGEYIASFLSKSEIPAEKIHLVGHSLGGHVSGYVGKTYEKLNNKKIARITGLDPAGPAWSSKEMEKEERLCDNDADFVDVIHTDVQVFGYTDPIGHVDFYPNGGSGQPGCPKEDMKENWNHQHATRLFIESVHSKLPVTEIDIKEDYAYNIVITHKDTPSQVIFGEHTPTSARGVYYFKTSGEHPYLTVLDSVSTKL